MPKLPPEADALIGGQKELKILEVEYWVWLVKSSNMTKFN